MQRHPEGCRGENKDHEVASVILQFTLRSRNSRRSRACQLASEVRHRLRHCSPPIRPAYLVLFGAFTLECRGPAR